MRLVAELLYAAAGDTSDDVTRILARPSRRMACPLRRLTRENS